MKKLLFAGLLCAGFQLGAQNHQTVSLAVGPGVLHQFSDPLEGGPSYHPQLGWGAGLDFNFSITDRLDVKAGLRYHRSISIYENNDLMYASEYSTGVYVFDPTLVHSVRFEDQNKAWQYLLGTRLFFSAPKTWRWYGEGEFGITRSEQRQTASPSSTYLTSGAGLGLQWLPADRSLGVFAQPMLRLMIPYGKNIRSDAFVIPAVEIGLRVRLFRGQ